MKINYIAIDIGASSGRLILSNLTNNKITFKEVHRFKNGFKKLGKYDCWDIDNLTNNILIGLEKIKQLGINNCFVGIDTWGVDYCLIDKNGNLIDNPISYRDNRTENSIEKLTKKISLEDLYSKTGIQIQPFNTIFQLFVEDEEKLKKTEKILLIPDYLGYYFTNEMVMEKTNASTTQLLNISTKKWDDDLLSIIGLSEDIFPKLVDPGTVLGRLKKEKFSNYNLPDATFITVASHDTASAVLGTPGKEDNWAYISSGTWSLLGIENKNPNTSTSAFLENYTNEWGVNNTFRFLKNIMGMWLIQEVSRIDNYKYSYAEIAEKAAKETAFQSFIDVNNEMFLNPENMQSAIKKYCKDTNQKVPESIGEIARCIYDSLAIYYTLELKKLEKIQGENRKIEKLFIVGGGANNHFLNQLTSNIAKIKVIAGPTEATAIGNLIMQMIVQGEFENIEEARKTIYNSFDFHEFYPSADIDIDLDKYKFF